MDKKAFLFAFLLFQPAFMLAQSLSIPQLFSDQMVYQRDTAFKIWGWDQSYQGIVVQFNEEQAITTANADGYWEVSFPPQGAGGPFTLSIEGSSTKTISDIYFGDVWLAGGQSNMEWQVGANIDDMEAELADTDYPEIRFFKVQHSFSVHPLTKLEHPARWKSADAESVKNFSAVAWFFAKKNHLEKDVPVGIIDNNWGGTPAQAWTPTIPLQTVPGYEEQAREMLNTNVDWEQIFEENDAKNTEKYSRIEDNTAFLAYGAHNINYDDSKWSTVELPNSQALTDFVWLRKTISLSNTENVSLSFGNPGKFTTAFINGKQVYRKIWSDDPKVVHIDASLLNKGENVLAIRTVEDWGNRAFIGSKNAFWLKSDTEKISLAGTWKYSNTVEPPMPDVVRHQHRPGVLYNAMINPITNYAIKGVIWYQGESNAGQHQYYQELFSTMIEEWRNAWKQGDFPFLFVQLANYQKRSELPEDTGWARLREAQTKTLAVNNTGMAVTIDIGDEKDIHPRNKKDVGHRLWQSARNVAYNERVISSGPRYISHTIEDNKIHLSFGHLGDGFNIKDGEEVLGFAIAGKDQVFHWANASIKGNKITVWSDNVEEPVAVRYAWGNNPAVNLYNSADLPVVPFRTDTW